MNDKRSWTPVIITVPLAAALWFFCFYIEWGNFFEKISVSAAVLALVALALGPRPEKLDNKLDALVDGVGSAALLYIVFWVGNAVSRALFDFAPDQVGGIYDKGAGTPGWAIGLMLLFVTGPVEEIFWRGFLQRRLQEKLGGFTGLAAGVGLYGLVHVSSWNFMLVGAALVAGAFWGLLYWKLGRLWPVIISHSLWSAFIFAVAPIT